MVSAQETLLVAGLGLPLACFVVLALLGSRLGKPLAGWFAAAGIGASTVLAAIVLYRWYGLGEAGASRGRMEWARIGGVPVTVGIQLDGLSVVMFFMVTLVSTCIFVFSIGYMAGHSDEVDGRSKYARFFAFLSLFCFSMLGLVLSDSLLFLFVFWELVGLCSYFLIGFYFHRRSATDAAIKAFVVNRVGDCGFLVGLMMVAAYLGDFSIDGAAARFRAQWPDGELFTRSFAGVSLATWMGVLLFCGAIGKSAQFPLHVWLPDAMEGPTPVSALIHAATMVAAGVYLVARIFLLLTPGAQAFIAWIGCLTLLIGALIAIVQTDIKRLLAYSTISQLGYMIFGMGVGAWIGALFHLLVHAFFKALMFLGSGQVIEGTHHEQDMRRMGGLIRRMPVTGVTFLVGVLAIAGAGLPGVHVGGKRIGVGGFFSKDEILAVAYQRTLAGDQSPSGDGIVSASEGGRGDGRIESALSGANGALNAHPSVPVPPPRRLPRVLFLVAVAVAYVTPFYMMRGWWMTFMGTPRDEEVYRRAHESSLMYVPLVALAVGTVVAGYAVFRPMVARAAPPGFLVRTFDPEGASGHAESLAQPIAPEVSHALEWYLAPAAFAGMLLAVAIYRRGLDRAARLAARLRPVHAALVNRLYFDAVYHAVFVRGVMVLKSVSCWVDTRIVDGLVNGAGWLVRGASWAAGRVLDRSGVAGSPGAEPEEPAGRVAGAAVFLASVALAAGLWVRGAPAGAFFVLIAVWVLLGIDGIVNDLGRGAIAVADAVRRPQTGRIRHYLLFAAGAAAAGMVLFVIV